MLETVKREITSEYKDFESYYLDYICSVQDRNIEREFRYFRSVNTLSPFSMQSIIDFTHKELRTIDPDNRSSTVLCKAV